MIEDIQIVAKLPNVEISEAEEDGKKIKFITLEDAIKEILTTVRDLNKKVG